MQKKAQTGAPQKKLALYLVNEYGEFGELMQVARLLSSSIGLNGLFVFARDDYGRLDEHKARCKEAGFGALSLSAEEFADLKWSMSGRARTADGNLPDTVSGMTAFAGAAKSGVFVALVLLAWLVAVLPLLVLALLAAPVAGLAWLLRRRRSRAVDPWSVYRSPLLGSAFEAARFPYALARYGRWKRHARAFMPLVAPDIVIMGQDYPGSYNSVLAAVARRRRVPCVIVPFAMYTARELAESFYSYPHHRLSSGIFGSAFGWLFPQWVFNFRGRRLLRLQASEILALELRGLGWREPWKPLSSDVHLLCQSRQALDYYAKLGKPRDQMVLTGSIWNDVVHANWARRNADRETFRRINELRWLMPRKREVLVKHDLEEAMVSDDAVGRLAPSAALALLSSVDANMSRRIQALNAERARFRRPPFELTYDIDPARKVLVVAWPANQYPARPVPGIPDYETLCKRLIDTLSILPASKTHEVWISLHPTVVGLIPPTMFENAGLRLMSWPLIDYVHCADAFMATVSSTLIWAVQCRIPAVNFDCYNYEYPEFNDMGCKTVQSFPALERIIHAMCNNEEHSVPSGAGQDVAEYWGAPDGGSRDRIVESISGHLGVKTAQRQIV